MRDDVWRVQIKHTVKKHLEKELQLRNRGIKVLSLFFIDRVANYRDYDAAGKPMKGKFAQWLRGGAGRVGKGAALRVARLAQAADREAAQRLFRPRRKGRVQGHARATRRPTMTFTT